MRYQVVAKPCVPSARWEYYPYWAPVRDKAAAERLASYAAQSGYEAAILHSVTAEMLEQIARRVVERQDTHLLPALRYMPGTRVAATTGRQEHAVETALHLTETLDPYAEGPDKAALDSRRLTLEMGPGGDVITTGTGLSRRLSFPQRMDIISSWLDLRKRAVAGEIGGAMDGTANDEADTRDAG